MHQKLTLEQIKEEKQTTNCPSCGSETKEFTYTENGEEFKGKKCLSCPYWDGE